MLFDAHQLGGDLFIEKPPVAAENISRWKVASVILWRFASSRTVKRAHDANVALDRDARELEFQPEARDSTEPWPDSFLGAENADGRMDCRAQTLQASILPPAQHQRQFVRLPRLGAVTRGDRA